MILKNSQIQLKCILNMVMLNYIMLENESQNNKALKIKALFKNLIFFHSLLMIILNVI